MTIAGRRDLPSGRCARNETTPGKGVPRDLRGNCEQREYQPI